MTRHGSPSVRIRDLARWWPLVLVVTLVAVGGAVWSHTRQAPSYTATTRLVIVPLAQWDETFIGTSLVRDAGEPKRTGATVAAQLDSRRAAVTAADYLGAGWTPDSVDAAVKVSAVNDTNVVDIVATSPEPDRAVKLSEGFARATLADRWRTILAELDARIAAITATTAADPNEGDASARLQTLMLIRDGGADPTLRIDSTSPAIRTRQLPIAVVVALATAGGLFVGLLAAAGITRLRRRAEPTTADAVPSPQSTPAYSPNGGS